MAKTIFVNVGSTTSWRLKRYQYPINFFLLGMTEFLEKHMGVGRYKVSLSRRDPVDYDYVLILRERSKKYLSYQINGAEEAVFCKDGFRKVFLFPPRKIYVTLEKI